MTGSWILFGITVQISGFCEGVNVTAIHNVGGSFIFRCLTALEKGWSQGEIVVSDLGMVYDCV